jgi:transketolase
MNLKAAANVLRILSVAAIEKAGSGHPGMPLGFADVFTVLAVNFLRFNSQDPRWAARDRLVLSAGHGSMLLYAFYYLAGYKDFELQDIKNFRTLDSKTPGHPEYGAFSAIETTTGPLGQGFATSVGMAIAAKKYAAYCGNDIADYKIYTIVGDGCLMEGLSYEAASIAGHLRLNNLIVLFDDNGVTIDGSTSLAISEDHLQKFQSLGWNTIEINGHNFDQIDQALKQAQNSDKPFFIACKTIIGYGTSKAGSCAAHGAPLGQGSLQGLRQFLNFDDDDDDFCVKQDLLEFWRCISAQNQKYYNAWQTKFAANSRANYFKPAKISSQTLVEINSLKTEQDQATRVSSGKIIEIIARNEPKVILGSADLSSSIGTHNKYCIPITKDNFNGNFIHYGPRENAMSAIMNGLALEGFLPIAGTFLVFSDYMRPGIRLSSLMNLKVIYIMTHDSIGLGEDGPTHQPIEHLSSLRSIPNLNIYRPADARETIGAFSHICANSSSPSLLALSRQTLPQVEGSCAAKVSKGAYFVKDNPSPDVVIFATGSELCIARDVCLLLERNNLKVSLISIVSFELFWLTSADYINQILQEAKIKVAIEAAASFGWHRLIGRNGMFFGLDEFGKSAPYQDLYSHFGLTAENIYQKIMQKYENRD